MNKYLGSFLRTFNPFGPFLRAIQQLSGQTDISLFDDFKNIGGFLTQKLGNQIGDTLVDTAGSYIGANMAPKDIQAAELQLQNQRTLRQTEFQDAVRSMQNAGINPALMYGSGANTSAGSAQVSNTAGSLSELIALASLPAQLKLLNKQADLVGANERNINQRTLSEEQNTKLLSIAAQFEPEIKSTQIAQMVANIDSAYANIDFTIANKDYITSQTDAQKITNHYLPKRFESEIGKNEADVSQSLATAAFTALQCEFANDNGFLMSSNDTLLLGTYIASLFKVEKSEVSQVVTTAVNKAKKYVKEQLGKDFKPWRKVDPDDAMNYVLEHHPKATKD